MNKTADLTEKLRDEVLRAVRRDTPLEIIGGGSKRFYGREACGVKLEVGGHRGIIDYAPAELMFTARAGTPLGEIEDALTARKQLLPFEPPYFGAPATLGGTIACGFSGPRRPYAGSARDFVLGIRCLTGKGEVLRFGGQVMKNVAGYDLSRLMVGALGTLGILLDITLKVSPRPAREVTLVREHSLTQALELMQAWASRPVPLSAACFHDDRLYLRLSGSEKGVEAAARKIGGEELPRGEAFWINLREHNLGFFRDGTPLWRLSLPPATPALDIPGRWLYDWGGAQRWLKTETDARTVSEAAAGHGGHATLFRGGMRSGEVFHPLSSPVAMLHRKLKHEFDPHGLLNRGRLYHDW